jgi:MFS transporter, SP family, arabinose:H+ symporter
LRILKRIAGPESAEFVLSEIKASLQTKRNSWRGLFQPGIRRVVAVSFCLAILVHVSGISTVIDYAPIIFRSAGWQIDAALFSTFILGAANLLFTIVAFWVIDRWGRKPLYIVGSLGMTVTLLSLSATALTGHFHGLIVFVLILAYLAFFEACIGPVFWTLIPEIFPNNIRGTAMTIPVLTQWIANGMVVLFFPAAFNQIGKASTFSVLALMAFLQAVFTWFFVPETKNKPLEEIEKFWRIATIDVTPSEANANPQFSETMDNYAPGRNDLPGNLSSSSDFDRCVPPKKRPWRPASLLLGR